MLKKKTNISQIIIILLFKEIEIEKVPIDLWGT